jgi:hypothetical protein
MANKTRRRKTKPQDAFSHPGTTAMLSRISGCNKPPIIWRKLGDGSWLECFLMSDCTYGNCHAVDPSDVPPDVRDGS